MTNKIKLSNTGKSVGTMGEFRELTKQFKDCCPTEPIDIFYQEDGNGGCKLSISKGEGHYNVFVLLSPDAVSPTLLAISESGHVVYSPIDEEISTDKVDQISSYYSLSEFTFKKSNWDVSDYAIKRIIGDKKLTELHKLKTHEFREAGMGHFAVYQGLFLINVAN